MKSESEHLNGLGNRYLRKDEPVLPDQDVSPDRFSGKELAKALGVSGAALSKAVKFNHLCKECPVAEWAVYSESGRVLYYEPPRLLAKMLRWMLGDQEEQMPESPLSIPTLVPSSTPTLRHDRPAATPAPPTKSASWDHPFPSQGSKMDKMLWWLGLVSSSSPDSNNQK